MISKTFDWNGATITWHRRTIRHKLMVRNILSRMTKGNAAETDDFEFYLYAEFANFVVRADVDGDIGFELPAMVSTDEEIMAGFEAYMDLPDAFHDALESIERTVEQPIGDADLTPDADPKD